MPRIRTVKPAFWDDFKLSQLSLAANLLFIGTWTHADDKGAIQCSADWIKSKIFPQRKDVSVSKVSKWMKELVDAGMLLPFEYRGTNYVLIRTFLKHQRIDKPQPCDIPDGILLETQNRYIKYSENVLGTLLSGKEIEMDKENDMKISITKYSSSNHKQIDSAACHEFIEEIKADLVYCNELIVKYQLSDKSHIYILIDTFFLQKQTSQHKWKNIADLRSHFQYWLPKYLSTFKTSSTNIINIGKPLS